MIHVTPSVEALPWSGSTYARAPHAAHREYYGPYQPAPGHISRGDHWFPNTIALDPISVGGCISWLDGNNTGYSDNTAMTDWPAIVGPTPTLSGCTYNKTGEGKPSEGTGIVNFDGINDYGTFGTNLMAANWLEFTVLLVFAATTIDTSEHCILSNDQSAFNGDLLIGVHPNNYLSTTTPKRIGMNIQSASAFTPNTSTQLVVQDDTDLVVDTYHAVIFRHRRNDGDYAPVTELWDGTNTKAASFETTTGLYANHFIRDGFALDIGRTPTNAKYMPMNLAEMAIWDRCITAAEAEALLLWANNKHFGT